jgi:hypothetical protein
LGTFDRASRATIRVGDEDVGCGPSGPVDRLRATRPE